MTASITRPTSEQIRFNSGRTGVQVLDDYMEAAELGNKTLATLLAQIFDTAGNLSLLTNRGPWAPATTYQKWDLVTYLGNVYLVANAHTSPGAWDGVNLVQIPGTNITGIVTPAEFPTTTNLGTATIAKADQAPNRFFAGPRSGANAQPTFRTIGHRDIPQWAVATGTNDLTLTPSIAAVEYVAGMVYRFIAPATNTGAMTVNASGLGAQTLLAADGAPLAGGAVLSGALIEIVHTGSTFRLASSPPQVTPLLYFLSTTG